MGLRITTASSLPGSNGVPGKRFTNQEVLSERLSMRWQDWVLRFLISDKMLRDLEERTGVTERRLLVGPTVDPSIKRIKNEFLGASAGLLAIQKMQKTRPNFQARDIQAFFYATNTDNFSFPPPGEIAAGLIGIQDPEPFDNSALACVNVASALYSVCSWLEDNQCENAMVICCDLGSGLMLRNWQQPFLFGDAAVAIFIEKDDLVDGGFTFSPVKLDTKKGTDIVHQIKHMEEPLTAYEGIERANDRYLRGLGFYEKMVWPAKLHDFLCRTDSSSNGFQLDPNIKIIPPQSAKSTFEGGIDEYHELFGVDIRPNIVANSVYRFTNTGSAAMPLPLDLENLDCEKNRIVFVAVGVGGVQAVFEWDPEAKEILTPLPRSKSSDKLVRAEQSYDEGRVLQNREHKIANFFARRNGSNKGKSMKLDQFRSDLRFVERALQDVRLENNDSSINLVADQGEVVQV